MTKGCVPCGQLDRELKKVKGEISAFEEINAASRQSLQDDQRRGFGYWINQAYGFNLRRIEPGPDCGDCHHLRDNIDGLIRRAIKKHPGTNGQQFRAPTMSAEEAAEALDVRRWPDRNVEAVKERVTAMIGADMSPRRMAEGLNLERLRTATQVTMWNEGKVSAFVKDHGLATERYRELAKLRVQAARSGPAIAAWRALSGALPEGQALAALKLWRSKNAEALAAFYGRVIELDDASTDWR